MKFAQVKELVDAHKKYATEESGDWKLLVEWYNGTFSFGSTRFPTYMNLLFMLSDSIGAAMSLDNPRFKMRPVRPSIDLQSIARTAGLVLDADARNSNLKDSINQVSRSCVVFPRAFMKVAWNHHTRAPYTIPLNARQVWWDFGRPFSDSKYVIAAYDYDDDDVKRGLKDGWDREGVATTDHTKSFIRDTPTALNNLDRLFKRRVVYEVLFPRKDRCVHFMEGAEKPLYDGPLPYRTVKNPYVMLSFHDNQRDYRGLSDAMLVRDIQSAINELDATAVEHAVRSVPVTLVDSSALESDTIDAIASAKPGDMIPVDGQKLQGRSLRDAIAAAPSPSLSPDYASIRGQLVDTALWVVGLPDFMRGQARKNLETATQAAQVEYGVKNRFSYRAGKVRQLMEEVGRRMWLLRLEHMHPHERVIVAPEYDEGMARSASVRDLAAMSDVEILAHDPLERSDEQDFQKLASLLGMLGQTGALDVTQVSRRLMELAHQDPELVKDAQEVAAAQAQLAQAQGAAQPMG